MIRRFTSGRITHREQRTMTANIPMSNQSFGVEPADRSATNTTRSGTEKQKMRAAETISMRAAKILHNTGIFGCGVERSRLPHWEQASAILGFTWSFGQSLTS
jgi:hypothetical protein